MRRSKTKASGTGQTGRTLLQRQEVCYALALVWTVLLVFALSIPGDSIPDIEDRFPLVLPEEADKGVHTFLFFFETLWLILAFRLSRWRRHAFFWAVGIAVLLALATESWQAWIPQRSSNLADLVANLFGIVIGVFVFWWKPMRIFRPEPDKL